MDYLNALAQDNLPLVSSPTSTQIDKLVINHKDKKPIDFPMEKESITIGRARDNDIVLADYAISRYHVRLERSIQGWIASDIGSTNGVVVNTKLVASGNTTDWKPNTLLIMGPFTLHWERTPAPVQPAPQPEQPRLEIPRQLNITDEPPEINIRNQQTSIYDDQPSTLSISIQNRRSISDTYQIQLIGLPTDWIAEPKQVLSLGALERGSASFVIRPTAFETMSSSEFPFSVQVSSLSAPSFIAAKTEKLVVMPRYQFITELNETDKSFGAVAILGIQNIGTAADFFEVEAHSPDPRITFETRHWNMALSQHTMDKMHIAVKMENRSWIRSSGPIPYSLKIRSKSGLERQHNSTVVVRPRLASIAFFVCLMVLVLIAVAAWSITQGGTMLGSPIVEQAAAFDLSAWANITEFRF